MTNKNGVGKTYIINVLALLKNTAIVSKTSSVFNISEETQIDIKINDDIYAFRFNDGDFNTKNILRDDTFINIELPIPYGKRFSDFPALGKVDMTLREMYIKNDCQDAHELTHFLDADYKNANKLDNLKFVNIKA